MKLDLDQILKDLSEKLHKIYGSKLKSVILYGSVARGTQNDDSDIDVMVLVDETNEDLKKYQDQLCEVSTDFALTYFKVFSIIDVSYQEYMKWIDTLPFFKNVSQEGIIVYAA